MKDDEGKFSLNGKTVLLRRGNYGLLVSWVHSCFEVVAVEILPNGNLKVVSDEQANKDFVGGMDIWSQGLNLFAWREDFDMPKVLTEKPTGVWENSNRPKLIVFIPPEGLNTKGNPEVP